MKVLVLGWVWPEPKSSAAGKRILQIMDVFHQMNMEIHFASAAQKSEYSTNWEYDVIEHSIEINSSSFDTWIKDLHPDIVLFDQINCEEYFAWRIHKQCPKAIRILDCEDLQMLRKGREKALRSKQEFNIGLLKNETLSFREIACIQRSHLSIIISEFEKDLLEKQFSIPPSKLAYFPLLADSIKETLKHNDRDGFVSIGNFLHAPNLDSVKYLKNTIWPLIRKKMPGASIDLYGAYPNDKVLQMNDPDNGFHIKGRAKDAFKVILKAKVLLAPLRFGSGQKGKLLDAMICQTPSVTTSIGAESMNGELDWNGFIEDDPESFASKAVELYQNEVTWMEAQLNGDTLLESRFNRVENQNRLKTLLEEFLKIPIQEESFENKMLNYHSFRNSEFMSKWIEVKNS